MTPDSEAPGAPPPLSIGVLVSGHGRGSNLGALLEACAGGEIAGRVAVVIGTRAEAPALERARANGADVVVISPRKYGEDDAAYAEAILRALEKRSVGLVCLAGYMRKLPPQVIYRYSYRIMNIHPALLPCFGGEGMYGEHVHQAVLESGMKITGCTVHFVDEQYDTGPIIVQNAVEVHDEDTSQTLAGRVLEQEHRALVRAVKLFAERRLVIEGRRVRILAERS